LDMYAFEGIDAHVEQISDSYTGSAYIFIDEKPVTTLLLSARVQ